MDKIVAIVGNEIILQSEVVGHLYDECNARTRAPVLAPDDPVLPAARWTCAYQRKPIVTRKAIEDSLPFEDEITERMDYQIQAMMQQNGF